MPFEDHPFLQLYNVVLMTRAGFPTAREFGGIGCTTTEPAPTVEPAPPPPSQSKRPRSSRPVLSALLRNWHRAIPVFVGSRLSDAACDHSGPALRWRSAFCPRYALIQERNTDRCKRNGRYSPAGAQNKEPNSMRPSSGHCFRVSL
jgi:hypothetical protein